MEGPVMTAVSTRDHAHTAGERTELARYTITSGRRVISGQRVDGVVILIDTPAAEDDDGRVYLIESGLEQDGNAAMRALLTDYVSQAEPHDEIPARANPLARYLEHLA
jgi:hypothetical protein